MIGNKAWWLCVSLPLMATCALHSAAPDVPARVHSDRIRTSDTREVCQTVSTQQFRHWDKARDTRLMRRDGVPSYRRHDYELDHSLSLNLGGSDDDSNLHAQARQSIVPYEQSSEAKDETEFKIHDLVCAGKIDLKTAQQEMLNDWQKAYRRYVNPQRVRP